MGAYLISRANSAMIPISGAAVRAQAVQVVRLRVPFAETRDHDQPN